jgi:hypothetical protein
MEVETLIIGGSQSEEIRTMKNSEKRAKAKGRSAHPDKQPGTNVGMMRVF